MPHPNEPAPPPTPTPPPVPDTRSVPRKISFVIRAVILLGLAFSIYEQQWLNALVVAGILGLTSLPMLVFRRLEIYIPPVFELLAIAFIFAALFLGETRGYYARYWWWDIALHTTSGALLGILGFLLVYILNETPRLDLSMRPGFVAFFSFCFALAIGAIWEIFEFSMDQLAGTNMQKPFLGDPSGLTDTMWDLIVDAIGALVIAILGYLYTKRGTRNFIDAWIQKFIAGNPQLFRQN